MTKEFINFGDEAKEKSLNEFNSWYDSKKISLITKNEENSTVKTTGENYCKIVCDYKEKTLITEK